METRNAQESSSGKVTGLRFPPLRTPWTVWHEKRKIYSIAEKLPQALYDLVEQGPIASIHGVVRWRLKDLVFWLREEFGISVSESTAGRELKALGFSRITARPRHNGQNEFAIEDFKKLSLRIGNAQRQAPGWHTNRTVVAGRGPGWSENQTHTAVGITGSEYVARPFLVSPQLEAIRRDPWFSGIEYRASLRRPGPDARHFGPKTRGHRHDLQPSRLCFHR